MGLIKLLKPGCAYLRSESDQRWNDSVECDVGGLVMPKELQEKIDKFKELYGKPPKDLTWEYHKY